MMLDAAMRLMQAGLVPSISDVAEAAQVSRATAYRYFPTQSVLIQAAVDEALGPILKWSSSSEDAEQRVGELIRFSYPRMHDYEVPLRGALRLALDQWARMHAGKLDPKDAMVRGHRIALLTSAVAPLRRKLGKARTRAAHPGVESRVRHRSVRRAQGYLGPGPGCGRRSGAVDVSRVDPLCRRGSGAAGAPPRAACGARAATARSQRPPRRTVREVEHVS